MNRAFRLGRVGGIPIEVDASWLIIAVLVFLGFLADLWDYDRSSGVAVLVVAAAAGSLGFFGSVLVHELSHSLVAVRRGVPVRRIRLFVFGGVSEIERDAATPGDELAIALAGPMASFVLGGVFVAAAVLVPSSPTERLLAVLAVVNLALGVFNLLPGFPLDGGRVLRAIVWRATGDFGRATRIAAAGGRVLAGLLAAGGIALLVLGRDVFGLWYVAIGWFLWRAAGASVLRLRVDEQIRGIPTATVMSPVMRTVPTGTRLADLVAEAPLRRGDTPVVVVGDGRVRGLVDARSVTRAPPPTRSSVTVDAVMERVGPDDVTAADRPLEDLLGPLVSAGGRLLVVADGRAVGVLTVDGLERWLRWAKSQRPV